MTTDLLANARMSLAQVERILDQGGVRYLPLPDCFIGVGVGVSFGEERFSVVSVSAGGNEGAVNLTIGILRDVTQDRLAILDKCNSLTRDNAAYPFFLHDAEAGWDVLMQVRIPLNVVLPQAQYFRTLVSQLPELVDTARKELAALVGGQSYRWTDADLGRLLIRSLA